ncbi:surface antigen BspA-like [Trichomonas vaginalis G3]|uniref:Surface antigen BspA-like n=1 Tax=Trichomonas vaginalis (strain ATCC PRA-98 / G3) TaxID=412133 RepID=A2DAS6_TRIV3|nr:regulation of response to stimulus [Trichomonas vaginalis G3]EAY22579.1 surface antigen BspA-like [Trichomonas vaginalis G3]KAI5497312.1 regulation of response to stimulus [Trichomonas vaginalis G3]|eukprot:XP_001583565.1 surface antigen BspA-like [Trichomonas vaginalis G3]
MNVNNQFVIGNSSFQNCHSLKIIIYPNCLNSIKPFAFMDCSSLTEISLPDSLVEISEKSFFGCTSLRVISLPMNLISLGNYSFSNCKSLREIVINSNCSIDQSVFDEDYNIENIIIKNENKDIFEQKILHQSVKSITFSSYFKEYPTILDFNHIEHVSFITEHGDSIINDNFVNSTNLNINITGNIHQISDNSFSHSHINNFLYCGNQIVEGKFLSNSQSYNNISVYKHYPSTSIGGAPAKRDVECPNIQSQTLKLKPVYIVLISIGCAIIVTAIIILFIRNHIIRQSQKRIEGKELLQKLVNEDFG